MGRKGVGQKCPDREAIPFCSSCHRCWHDAAGYYKGWSKAERRAYAVLSIAHTQRLVEGLAGGEVAV